MTPLLYSNEVSAFMQRHCYTSATVRAALIDMDGTLYDSMPSHSAAWEAMTAEADLPTIPGEFFLHEGRTGAETIDLLMLRCRRRHATDSEKERLYRRKTELFAAMPAVSAMPGAAAMLATLAAGRITRILVAGSAQSTLISRLDSDYPGMFPADRRVTARDVTHGKPHPEPYLHAMEIAREQPGHCIVIENAPIGIEAGAASGAFTVGVATGPIPAGTLRDAGADIVFPSMPAFADALPALLTALRLTRPDR